MVRVMVRVMVMHGGGNSKLIKRNNKAISYSDEKSSKSGGIH